MMNETASKTVSAPSVTLRRTMQMEHSMTMVQLTGSITHG